ncbi:MAG: hypothetical protein Kow0042_16100 [Calditrichia bacterium]
MQTRNGFLFLILFILLVFTTLIFSYPPQENPQERKEWVAAKWADTLKNPLQGNVAATEAGKKLFQTNCAVCHGETGKGDGIAAQGLEPKPKDLSSRKVQEQTDGALFWKITTGNLPMASYKEIFSEEQRWQLVNYIRILGEKSAEKPSEGKK